ncbi:DUF5930 domain-containing protein [Oceanicella actignis]|uniref:DUF5930 domain-containing protein n=1 Tax=Oceanicella actignis TaxID=1189325 RepID=UPI0011E7EEB4|nr:DUF5930 domain-containing protein [Oceanicella actignis]TYO88499.1 murein DD-endopeptidase MepM/ murein hydrolase activator NlpD [Oceanicella actignis]
MAQDGNHAGGSSPEHPAGRAGAGLFAEKRIFIRSGERMRYLRLSRRAQIAAAALGAALTCWTAFATVSLATLYAERAAQGEAVAALRAGYERRLAREVARAEAAQDAMSRLRERVAALDAALDSERGAVIAARADRAAAQAEAAALRERLRQAVAEREAARRSAEALRRGLDQARRRLAGLDDAAEDWGATVAAVAEALDSAVAERDAAERRAAEAAEKLAALENRMREDEARRARMYAQLEDAMQIGLGSLERIFARAGMDVEKLIGRVRAEYSGAGGPFIPVEPASVNAEAGSDAARVTSLITGLERLNLMQVAAARLPLAAPLRGSYRLTSGFGIRRDPKNGRRRMHDGVDVASARGTPILATADGVVTYAGWQRGYGRVVKIRHDFGYETVYAHLDKIRVKKGERVAQGDRIGDMGNSGRSTGVHLHYEVRNGGRPINPLRYIEAARNVF